MSDEKDCDCDHDGCETRDATDCDCAGETLPATAEDVPATPGLAAHGVPASAPQPQPAASPGAGNGQTEHPEPPAPADCMQGRYKIAVVFACTCGGKVALASGQILTVALANGSIRMRHDCGQWWYLSPEKRVNVAAAGNGGPNRQQRRAQAAMMRRTPGGLVVPR